ncbi:hypothetical protein V2J09_000129 [Rumex salicifolius]
MFCTTLSYVALRILGEGINHNQNDAVSTGRKWILDHGGATGIPSWGKFWLAVLGVYEWDGCNPVPPEFWLLPYFFPIHPGNMLCYARLVYMPMSYLYGKRFVGEITPLIQQLREEEDVYYPHPSVQDILWDFLYYVAEPMLKLWPLSKLREKALKVAMEHIHYEDMNSRYITIGCIEKVLCMVACWVEDPHSEAYKLHLARVPDYLWVAEDGMKMQVREDPSANFKQMYRHTCKGAWTFSTQDHGWQVSDCTGEGLKVALLYSQMPAELIGESIEIEWLYDSINVILTLQKFNPTDFFEDVLIETEYVECTSSVIQGLTLFTKLHPRYRRQQIETCIENAVQYILNEQNPDGSWRGSWGICFTYGTWFAVEALTSCGMNYNNCLALRKASDFLLSRQLHDGGWGESYLSCTNKVYTNTKENRSNLVQTSWALLSLIKAGQVLINPTFVNKGVRLLINSQVEKDGDFPQQEITGSFCKTCSLNYGGYRNIFPIWTLGEYRKICYEEIK